MAHMTERELLAKRANLWENMKDFLDTHRGENGCLSAEDDATYAKMEADLSALGKEIDRERSRQQTDAAMNARIGEPLTSKPEGSEDDLPVRATKAYKQAMLNAFRAKFLRVSDVLEKGVDANGGYLVPTEMDERIIEKLTGENIMRQLGTVITTESEHKINIAASSPAASWVAESGTITFGGMTFAQKALDAHKLVVAVKVTKEMLADSAIDLEAYLEQKFAVAIANAEEDAFLTGNGSGKPTGIFDATNGGTVADTVTTLSSNDIIDLVYTLGRGYRKNASWIFNDKDVALVRKFKDQNGNYIWQPSYAAGEPDTLLGYKLNTSAFAPEKSIAFGDYSFYNIGDRGVRSFDILRELFAATGEIGFTATQRVDGILTVPEAVQILKVQAAGGNS